MIDIRGLVTWWHSDICEIWRYAPWICNVESLSQSWKEQLWVKAKKSARMPSQPKSAKKSNLSLPKNSPDRFQEKKNLKILCSIKTFHTHFFHPFFWCTSHLWTHPVLHLLHTSSQVWSHPNIRHHTPLHTPGMTRPTALRSCGAGTGAAAAALGFCRPKTIFASFETTSMFRTARNFLKKKYVLPKKNKTGEAWGIFFDIWLNGFRAEHPKCFRSAPAWARKRNTNFKVFFSSSFSHEIDFQSGHNML